MELNTAREKYSGICAKIRAFEHAAGVMQYDAETAMPRGGGEKVGETMGFFSGELYKLSTSDDMKECVKTFLEHSDEIDEVLRREAEELSEEISKIERIPIEEYIEYQVLASNSSNVWHSAKPANDFAMFLPYLEKMVDFQRRFAGYAKPGMPVYDALLDDYEKGLSVSVLDVFFADVRKALVPLIHDIQKNGRHIDTGFLEKDYPVHIQKEYSDYLMKLMTIDREYCAIGETEHPFTTEFSKHDVRITTHYHAGEVLSSMYSVIHEGGHALYELNTGDNIYNSALAMGASMGLHESQSRFFENIIGRSLPFIRCIFPKMAELFPEQLSGVTAEMFHMAANKAQPSLIRTEADELTYPLHIMVRYELEKQLMDGSLSAKELPEAWNAMYKDYLGIDVPDDTHGVLQDSHWSSGLFGYFPSYAIGSAYSAQVLRRMEKEMDLWGFVEKGELAPVVSWLTDKLYKYGRLKKPAELVVNMCGGEFDPRYYTDYLTEKFTEIYFK